MTDGLDGLVTGVLELASKKQIADALAMLKEMMPSVNPTAEVESLHLLLHGADSILNKRYEQGVRDVLLSLKQFEKGDYKHLLDWAYSSVGFTLGVLGNPEGGLQWVSKAIVGAERSEDYSQYRRSLRDESSLFAMLGQDEKSIASLEKALGLTDPSLSTNEHAKLQIDLAHANLNFARRLEDAERRNDLTQNALKLASAALELLKEAEDEQSKVRAYETVGSALSLLGKFADAEAAFKTALSLSENDEQGTVETLTSYAQLLGETNHYANAKEALTRAYDKAVKENFDVSLDRILETRVRLEMLAGNNRDAQHWTERRFRAMEKRYRKQIASAVWSTALFTEIEHKAQMGYDDLTALPENLQQSWVWQDETLKDPLTNCFNRRGLTVLSGSFFASQNKTALALVDLDYFKNINDNFGHATGDKVIQAIAEIIKKCFRDTDLVTRYGGEEFIVLLKGIESNVAWGVCERLRLAIEHFGWGTIADGLQVTASIGLSVRTNDDFLDTLTEKAEVSLHHAKDEGRNKVVLLQ